MQMAHNHFKGRDEESVTKEDVSEAVNSALDHLVDEERSDIRKRNGSSLRALDQLNTIQNDILRDSGDRLQEVIA